MPYFLKQIKSEQVIHSLPASSSVVTINKREGKDSLNRTRKSVTPEYFKNENSYKKCLLITWFRYSCSIRLFLTDDVQSMCKSCHALPSKYTAMVGSHHVHCNLSNPSTISCLNYCFLTGLPVSTASHCSLKPTHRIYELIALIGIKSCSVWFSKQHTCLPFHFLKHVQFMLYNSSRKVYNSIIFRIFTELHSRFCNLTLDIFSSSQKENPTLISSHSSFLFSS